MRAFVVAAALVLSGCSASPIQQVDSGNSSVSAKMIAIVDGCKLYRVEDGGYRTIYFAKCGANSNVTWDENCGRGCTRHELVTAEIARP